MTEFIHDWTHKGNTITFTWLGNASVTPDRVYAFAFTPEQKLLLVTDPEWDPAGWLPGEGIENTVENEFRNNGETP